MNAETALQPLLDVRELATTFHTDEGQLRAVRGIDLTVNRAETVALVGESGCGKSVTALSILRLVPPPGRIESGRILFDGRDLMELDPAEMRSVRGRDIGIVFQEPMSSLNPVFNIGSQVAEVIRTHRDVSRSAALDIVRELLATVRIPEPEERIHQYPHQLSGGMQQRVMIAMALALKPKLVIADEPTTALDVTVQAQILDLMRQLQREMGMAVLLITHDLGVVSEMADRVIVMYAGTLAEVGARDVIFSFTY